MAEVRLSDVIVPSVFTEYLQRQSIEKNPLLAAGVVDYGDPTLAAFLAGPGQTVNIPHYNDLGDAEANVGDDVTGNAATPQKIGTSQVDAIRQKRNQHWKSMDIVPSYVGNDPLAAIGDRVSAYWRRQDHRILLAALKGVIADNVNNDSGDMVYDIATDDAGAITAAELFSADAFLQTLQTMGDSDDSLGAVFMHSVVFRRAQTLNLIAYIPDAEGRIDIPTYMGRRVFVADTMPAVTGLNRITYTTYVLGAGSFAWAEGLPHTPVEVSRNPLNGNGEGEEILSSRREFILHPRGIKWVGGSLAGQAPTNAELENAANWDRVYDRKEIRIAALETNG